jgi:hypothetical protein
VNDDDRAGLTLAAINHNWRVRAGNRTVTFIFDRDPERRMMLVTVWQNNPDQPGWPDITWEQFVGAELFSGERNKFDCGTTDPVVARNWLVDFGRKRVSKSGHPQPTKETGETNE